MKYKKAGKYKNVIVGRSLHGVFGLNNFVNIDSIYKKIATYVASILPRVNIEDMSGWRLALTINPACTDFIAIYKKFKPLPSIKEYEILISIPIPDNIQVPYGMPTGRNGTIGVFRSARGTGCHLLDPEYDKYANLEQYFLISAIKAIDLGFTKGLPCDGKEIKFSRFIDTPAVIPPHSKHAIKYKQARARMAIKVPALSDFANINSINRKLNTYLESIPPRIRIEDLSGGRLIFLINSFSTDLIAIYKKLDYDFVNREYVISIAIPLPDNTQVPYGMPPGRDGTIGAFRPVESPHFYPLDPEYDKYDNLDQYILESVIKAIEFGLTKGFTDARTEIKFSSLIDTRTLPSLHKKYVMEYKQVAVVMEDKVAGLDDFAGMGSIYKKIGTYVNSILPRINIKDLSGWKLTVGIDYVCAESISILKKLGAYPSDREYVTLIAIPIPDNTQAPYGMSHSEDEPIEPLKLKRKSDFHLLDPEYHKYDNLEQYILESVIKAMDFGFTKGFGREGKVLKFKDL